MSRTYYCNCYELTGSKPELNSKVVETQVDSEGICVHCGYYALRNKDVYHYSESERFDWDNDTNMKQLLDETVLQYYYAEQAAREGKKYRAGRGNYARN